MAADRPDGDTADLGAVPVPGAAVGAVSAGGERVCWVAADGEIVLADATSGVELRAIALRPGAEARRIEAVRG
ncbi:MAG: hypothetical protein ABMA64_09440 [Myxococcota bacterium]